MLLELLPASLHFLFSVASGTGISALLTLLALWGWVVGLQVCFDFSAQIGGRLYFLILLHLKYSFILKILSRKPILPPFFFLKSDSLVGSLATSSPLPCWIQTQPFPASCYVCTITNTIHPLTPCSN